MLEGAGSCVHSSPFNLKYVEGHNEIPSVGFDENQNSIPTLFKGQAGGEPILGLPLGTTSRNG